MWVAQIGVGVLLIVALVDGGVGTQPGVACELWRAGLVGEAPRLLLVIAGVP